MRTLNDKMAELDGMMGITGAELDPEVLEVVTSAWANIRSVRDYLDKGTTIPVPLSQEGVEHCRAAEEALAPSTDREADSADNA